MQPSYAWRSVRSPPRAQSIVLMTLPRGKRYEGLLKANNIPLKSKRGNDFEIGDRLYVAVAGPGNKRGGGTPTIKTSTTNPDAGDDANVETPSKKRKRATAGAAKKNGGAVKKGKKVKEEPEEPEEVKEEGEDDVMDSIELEGDFDVDDAIV